MKILIICPIHLGDNISDTLPLAYSLKNKNPSCVIDTLVFNKTAYYILKHTPYFNDHIVGKNIYENISRGVFPNDIDFVKEHEILFKNYDQIYCLGKGIQKRCRDAKFIINNLVERKTLPHNYTPYLVLESYDMPLTNPYLDIKWYDEFFVDFKCSTSTVVLNCESVQPRKNYNKQNRIIDLLSEYDVRVIDTKVDIRTNIHLINQSPYVLTTDTSTLWIAKCLNKQPHVFFAGDVKFSEIELGLPNLVSSHKHVNDIPPEESVNSFFKKITKWL